MILPRSAHWAADVARASAGETTPIPLLIPVLIRDFSDVEAAIDCVRQNLERDRVCLAGAVLLVDFADAAAAYVAQDYHLRELIEKRVRTQVAAWDDDRPVDVLFRQRKWNAFDCRWMGWERKRGKLIEFMRLTRGLPTSFIERCPERWLGVKYVMTVDIDTRIDERTIPALRDALEAAHLADIDSRPAIMAPTLDTLDRPAERWDRWLVEPHLFGDTLDWKEPRGGQLLFGRDLFHGKGMIAVDDFLARVPGIPDNSILSHDHLEALLCGACSISRATIFEPFPATRAAWERRQHRWYRGDVQLLPWVLRGRGMAGAARERLPWSSRVIAARIAGAPCNRALQLAAVLLFASISAERAIAALLIIACTDRGTLADGLLAFLRSQFRGYRGSPFWPSLSFHAVNAVMRTLGFCVFFQRDAVLGAHATVLTLFRLLRPGRKGLLEWHPDRPNSATLARRRWEVLLISGNVVTMILVPTLPAPALLCLGWAILAAIIARMPPISHEVSSSSHFHYIVGEPATHDPIPTTASSSEKPARAIGGIVA
jgi:cyclic beta-1,2-glucan synthetase